MQIRVDRARIRGGILWESGPITVPPRIATCLPVSDVNAFLYSQRAKRIFVLPDDHMMPRHAGEEVQDRLLGDGTAGASAIGDAQRSRGGRIIPAAIDRICRAGHGWVRHGREACDVGRDVRAHPSDKRSGLRFTGVATPEARPGDVDALLPAGRLRHGVAGDGEPPHVIDGARWLIVVRRWCQRLRSWRLG